MYAIRSYYARDVNVTITGTNDIPGIGVEDLIGAVTEDAASPTLSERRRTSARRRGRRGGVDVARRRAVRRRNNFV